MVCACPQDNCHFYAILLVALCSDDKSSWSFSNSVKDMKTETPGVSCIVPNDWRVSNLKISGCRIISFEVANMDSGDQ